MDIKDLAKGLFSHMMVNNNEVSPPTDEQTIYFKNGKMYKVYPSDEDSWYDARYLVSDGILYDLENVEDVMSIPTPSFNNQEDHMEGYGVTGSLDYVIRMKAGKMYNANRKELCSACLWKSTELMFANPSIAWSKTDYNRLIYWHLEMGMEEEANKARDYLSSHKECTENPFNLTALKIKDSVLSKQKLLGEDLVAFNYFGDGCCELCSKMNGRVYSISGRSKCFPKLPEYVKKHGNFHSGCRCSMSGIFASEKTIIYKGKRTDARSASRRPWVDNRTQEELDKYAEYLKIVEQRDKEEKNREAYAVRKGIITKEYEALVSHFPHIAPKSMRGYVRMKNANSKNYLKLKQLAESEGIHIS